MFTIYEMMDYNFNPDMTKVRVYDLDGDGEVWTGWYEDMPDEFQDLEIDSWCADFNDGVVEFCFSSSEYDDIDFAKYRNAYRKAKRVMKNRASRIRR